MLIKIHKNKVEYYIEKLFVSRRLLHIIFLCSSWIHDCDKMVDWQKALLMMLLALLIYPNDIFGKRQIFIMLYLYSNTDRERERERERERDFDQFASVTRYLSSKY